jgi:hypothetical protein
MEQGIPHTGQDLIGLSNNPSLPAIEEPEAIIDPGDRHGFGRKAPRVGECIRSGNSAHF